MADRPFLCGHPRTPENCKPNGTGRNGKKQVTCRACRIERDRQRPEAWRNRQAREHNRYTRYRRDLRNRIESKRQRIEKLKQELIHAT